ncbi:hypothetical protein Ahy_A10g049840 [Arachis hypogaea]|uniref:Endonuclease/exonuclease/phosphatase domain-containing protein n=1 Tax=Arachis hypogaea TaxID=3818 RepID=A0A445B807_ARAHY|nr:hypothetical protein Ahy_A10g049840 [Arachis hypogaea]
MKILATGIGESNLEDSPDHITSAFDSVQTSEMVEAMTQYEKMMEVEVEQAWNIRGVANQATIYTLIELKRQSRPDITLLYETKCSGERAKEVIKALNYNFEFLEEANGFVSEIWSRIINMCIWKSRIKITNDGISLLPQEGIRRVLWENLKRIADNTTDAWMSIGDFNEIAEEGEKRVVQKLINIHLMDLGYVGSKYTWKGGQRKGMNRVFKRLDRGLANAEWRREFMNARVEVLPRVNSDHHPLLAILNPSIPETRDKSFRFKIMWKTHLNFNEFVTSAWQKERPILVALKELAKRWKRFKENSYGERT